MKSVTLSVVIFCILATMGMHGDEPVMKIVSAERAFAALSVKDGIRESFLRNFSTECVILNPQPVNGYTVYKKRANSKAKLEWFPSFAILAASGELGVTTGPWKWSSRSDTLPSLFGHFLSVWKYHEQDGWKVVFDGGTRYPFDVKQQEQENFVTLKMSYAVSDRGRGIDEAENGFASMSRLHGVKKAISVFASPGIRLYRIGSFPHTGSNAAAALLKSETVSMDFKVLKSDHARSNDLAYSYGIAVAGGKDTNSFFHVWKRSQQDSKWEMIVDLMMPYQ